MNNFVYADNAATTKLDSDAFEAMKPYLLDEYGNVSQPYSFSRSGKKALKKAREIAEKLMKGRQRVAAQKGEVNGSIFTRYVSILTIGLNSMSLSNVLNLTMY